MINVSYLQNWLTEVFPPCALVYCSDIALNSIKKNNLTPGDFIRPFGDFKGKKIELHTIDKTNASPTGPIRNFILDIYDNTKFKPVLPQNIQEYFAIMFKYIAPEWKINSPAMTKINQEPYNKYLLDSFSTIWYKQYEELYFQCHCLNDYELFKQPLFNICICSIKEEPNVINKLKEIKNLPRLIEKGIYDNPIDNLIIVLNDVSENNLTEEEIQKLRKKFKNEFKVGIFFWDINTNKRKEDESEQIYLYEVNKNSEFWRRYIHKIDLYDPDNYFYRNKKTIFGEYITQNDIKIYKEEFQNYFIQNFLKKIVVKIQNLNDIKKQKSNMFTSIFKVGKKDEIVYYPDTLVYKFNALERLYINLGLLYFYFRNYDAAFEILRVLYTNIKTKSAQHKERLKIKLSVIKFLCNLNKKEYNFNDEVVFKSKNTDILIGQQLFLIKMLEHNRKFALLRTKIKDFMVLTWSNFQKTKIVSVLDYLFPLSYEKTAIYYLIEDKFRKFLYYMVMTGKYYNKLGQITKPYALLSFSNLFKFLENPNYSFISSRKKITKKMTKISNATNYYEGGYQLTKNCLEFSVLYDEIKKIKKEDEIKEGDEQSYFIGIFLNMINKIKNNFELRSKIDITALDIPQIDDGSLLIVEENDYNIKKICSEIYRDKKKWTIFNHYKKSYFTNPYVNLDNVDIARIKLLNDIINTKKAISNFYSRRKFYGNINQKLFVKCLIKNPLLITLQVTSIKLHCDFIPEKKDDNNSEIKINDEKAKNDIDTQNNLILNEEKYDFAPMEEKLIELNVASSFPGKVIIKGLSFVLFTDSQIIHPFYRKRKNKLYQYRHKSYSTENKKRKSSTDSNSGSEHQSQRNSDITNSNNTSNIDSIQAALSAQINFTKDEHFSKKTKIEYIIKDYNDDIYLEFPMGLDIDIYLYQLILFPMILHNTSSSHRIRRFSIFIENSDDRKIKSFYKYITKDIELNTENKSQKILIPIFPINITNDNQNLYIKVLVKCADEMRINPIEVKRFIIKLNVKDSFSFSVKEIYNNLNLYDKKNDIFRQIDFSLKTDLKISNKTELINITIDNPLFNDKLILNNRQNYVLNDSDIHELFKFHKDENISTSKENKNKFDIILNQKDIYQIDEKDESNNHIFDKFNKIINNSNDITIIFPWKAENPDKKTIIQGLYLYELNLSGPKLTKDFIREIFYNSTEIKIMKQKITNEKTFVSIDLAFNKSGISSLSDIISQYDIYIDKEENPEIFWMGLQKYTVINKVDKKGNDMFLCKFNFSTNYKGILEVNRISIRLYKKNEEKNINEAFMMIKHISKPISIVLD